MSETASDTTLLPPLLNALDALEFVARHVDPSLLDAVMEAVNARDGKLREVNAQSGDAPQWLRQASDETLVAFDELRAAQAGGDMRAVYRALRHVPRALEAIYPHAHEIAQINRFFVDPALRDNAEVLAHCMQPPQDNETGIVHIANEPGSRGGHSLYVPESYSPERAYPLVVALHGGAGNGRGFLWSWLRDARTFGAIVISPTATGPTWALMGDDTDTPNIMRMIADVRSRYTIDASQILMTGMSDGGTFCYVSGLESNSSFTHLAPVAASFHPMLAQMADAERLRGLPIYMTHGALDWMFPVEIAQQAQRTLKAAGANVTYKEIDDLSHTYPREINAALIGWLRGA